MLTPRSVAALATLLSGAALAAPAPPTPPPANDECPNATPISGNGVFNFDLTEATTGQHGQGFDCGQGITIENDVWFVWTAPCTGLVTIQTCGQTVVNTKIAFWLGTTCPAPGEAPFCCADDECNRQSLLRCEAVCGEQYLIQIGRADDGLAPGPGTFTIDCEGEPCAVCDVAPGQCCNGRPRFEDPTYTFAGQVAVGTASPGIVGGMVVTVYDFADLSPALPDVNYNTIGRYSDPSWTGQNLGSVFGAALDPSGNIYVTATTSYFFDQVGPGGAGAVYRIDTTTGAISTFATLPNTGPALGNITYDCANGQFFVTNHEDGLIYRLDTSGAVLSTYDHGAPDDGNPGFAPLGERLWGVTVHDGRVWYATWAEDSGRPDATVSNEIWSVALGGGGDFAGVGQLEIALPPRSGTGYSNPVSDLRFTPAGTLHVAERSMSGDSSPNAHDARLMEFSCEDGTWVAGPATFSVGVFSGENSAGGVDIDYRTGGRTWVSGDALHFGGAYPDYVYGFQGLPLTGGALPNSLLFDYNGVTNDGGQDKTSIGDIEISCPACLDYTAEVKCEAGPDGATGKYLVSLTLTNNSGVDASYILLPGAQTQPNVIVLDPPLPGDGSTSVKVDIMLCDIPPDEETFCFTLVLADRQVEECCRAEICVELPVCCAEFSNVIVECDPAGGGYLLTFDVQNLTSDIVEHLFLIPQGANPPTVTPDYVDVASLPPGGTTTIGPVLVTGANGGDTICILVTLHDQNLDECCSEQLYVTLPECEAPMPCDRNNDGVVDFQDLLIVLANWGGCCEGDVNDDGITDFQDLLLVLSSWTT